MKKMKENFSSEISSIHCALKKQLQEKTMESPAKRARHSDIWQVPRQGNVVHKTSTPTTRSKTLDFKSHIDAFKSHFESGPDFQIYDDHNYNYNYPVTPAQGASYRNLVRGNTPAPPLPPRNRSNNTPPQVIRNCRVGGGLRQTLQLDFNSNIEKQVFKQLRRPTKVGLRESCSTNCLSI